MKLDISLETFHLFQFHSQLIFLIYESKQMPQDYIAASHLVKVIAKGFAGFFGIIPQLLQVMEELYLTIISPTASSVNQINNVYVYSSHGLKIHVNVLSFYKKNLA